MTHSHFGILVVGSILLQTLSTESSTTILTVLTDQNNSPTETTRILFDDTIYSYFYDCLCGNYTTRCAAYYEKVNLENRVKVSSVVTDSVGRVLPFTSNYYRCQNIALEKHVTCTRLKRYRLKCLQTDNIYTELPTPPSSTCGMACVGIQLYAAKKESLSYNSSELKKGVCQRSCFAQVKAKPKISEPMELTTTSTPGHTTTSVPEINTVGRKRWKEKHLEHYVPLFTVLAVGLLFAVLVITVLGVIWERKKRTYEVSKQCKSSTPVKSSIYDFHNSPGVNNPAPAYTVQSSNGTAANGTLDQEVAL